MGVEMEKGKPVDVCTRGNSGTHAVLSFSIYSWPHHELPQLPSSPLCQTLHLTAVQAVVPLPTLVFASHPSSSFGAAALSVPHSPSSPIAPASSPFPIAFSSRHPLPPSSTSSFLIVFLRTDSQNILDPVSSSQPHSYTSSAQQLRNSPHRALDQPGKIM
jgi:hypothetical protein